jgi:DNA-binding FadR family transcriptional regulator
MNYKKVKQNRAYEGVVEQLQASILNGDISPGEVFPGERDLSETFGVSRGTIREALRVLEQKGLIEIKVGIKGGAIVKSVSTKLMSEGLDMLIRSKKIELRHIGEFRAGVEGLTAYLAAQRATVDDHVKLKTLLSEAQDYYNAGLSHWDDMLEAGTQIHRTIAKITRNPVYISIHRTIHDNIHNYYLSFLKADSDIYEENFRDLSNIVNAIVEGESEKAMNFAQDHVTRFTRYMENNEP